MNVRYILETHGCSGLFSLVLGPVSGTTRRK